jgi:hypothetical protein
MVQLWALSPYASSAGGQIWQETYHFLELLKGSISGTCIIHQALLKIKYSPPFFPRDLGLSLEGVAGIVFRREV